LAKQSRLDTVGYTAESLKQFYFTLLFDFEKKCHPNLIRTMPDGPPALEIQDMVSQPGHAEAAPALSPLVVR
jgi:hypothetical protein